MISKFDKYKHNTVHSKDYGYIISSHKKTEAHASVLEAHNEFHNLKGHIIMRWIFFVEVLKV
jgi:hypothetical protein